MRTLNDILHGDEHYQICTNGNCRFKCTCNQTDIELVNFELNMRELDEYDTESEYR